MIRQNVSVAASEIMLASIQPSTISSYSSALKKWWKFCGSRKIDPFLPTTNEVLDFLVIEFNTGLAYSTLNCTRSAISLIVGPRSPDQTIFSRFFKGLFNLRPAQPKYKDTWDPQIVFKFFSSPPSSSLNLLDLSKKLITLLALTTGHRMQTFQKITLQNIQFNSSQATIFIPDRIKTSGKGKLQPLLVLPFYPDPQICPARTLQLYIAATQPLRGAIQNLFITSCPPIRSATTQTLSRWTKWVLVASGVDPRFTAHSTRHASTSAAQRGGVNIDCIMNSAGWTTKSQTFASFYNRPLNPDSSSFALTVLQKND